MNTTQLWKLHQEYSNEIYNLEQAIRQVEYTIDSISKINSLDSQSSKRMKSELESNKEYLETLLKGFEEKLEDVENEAVQAIKSEQTHSREYETISELIEQHNELCAESGDTPFTYEMEENNGVVDVTIHSDLDGTKNRRKNWYKGTLNTKAKYRYLIQKLANEIREVQFYLAREGKAEYPQDSIVIDGFKIKLSAF